jgi:two-component system, cell cycle response regulator DivK
VSNPIPRTLLVGWVALVVEDDFDSREIAVRVLRHYGAQVYTAENGQEALAMLETVTPRFIVSDLSMPVMTGWELMARLKADARFSDIPVIALTAHAMVGDKEKATAAGFYNHLTKPLAASNFMRDLVALLQSVPQFTESLVY